MNRDRMLIGLGVALLVAFLLSNFVYHKFQEASAVKPVPMDKIVVAARPMPLGTRLDSSMLRTISWPIGQPVAGMCRRTQDCTNRALITPVALEKGLRFAIREGGHTVGAGAVTEIIE